MTTELRRDGLTTGVRVNTTIHVLLIASSLVNGLFYCTPINVYDCDRRGCGTRNLFGNNVAGNSYLYLRDCYRLRSTYWNSRHELAQRFLIFVQFDWFAAAESCCHFPLKFLQYFVDQEHTKTEWKDGGSPSERSEDWLMLVNQWLSVGEVGNFETFCQGFLFKSLKKKLEHFVASQLKSFIFLLLPPPQLCSSCTFLVVGEEISSV